MRFAHNLSQRGRNSRKESDIFNSPFSIFHYYNWF